MKNIRKGILTSLFSCMLFAVFAQTPLRISQVSGSSWPSSIAIDSSIVINVAVSVDSTTAFNGSLGFAYNINTLNYLSDTNIIQNTSLLIESISPPDSIIRTLTVQVSGPAFIVGPSVVVIWPISTSGYARDSLRFIFEVRDIGVGLHHITKNTLQIIPLDSKLWIIKAPETRLNYVRIYNLLGETILDIKSPTETVDLPLLNTGIYISEIGYNNNERKVFKFYR